MTTFDWSLPLSGSSRKQLGSFGFWNTPQGWGRGIGRPWLSLEYKKCIRNVEVVYKDLYINKICKDTS